MAPTDGKTPVVDVHSHLFPSTWIDLLKGRDEVPCIKSFPPSDELRLVNRAGQNGKPLAPLMFDITTKLAFMDTHNIDISVISLGNPWIDFVSSTDASKIAQQINDQFEELCSHASGRIFFFATLPLSAGLSPVLYEIQRLSSLSHCRGIVMGTRGFGSGLDEAALIPIYEALAVASLPFFLHPNYGLPGTAADVFGPCCGDYGQVLPVSMGFTLETTLAVTRLVLSGVFDKVPELQVILSHAGGALPFLSGRVESCVQHDKEWEMKGKLKEGRKSVWECFRENIYLDGVVFDKVPLRCAVEASGVERVMFGTDHPLFGIPMDGGDVWKTVISNRDAVKDVAGDGDEYAMIMGGNAVKALKLEM